MKFEVFPVRIPATHLMNESPNTFVPTLPFLFPTLAALFLSRPHLHHLSFIYSKSQGGVTVAKTQVVFLPLLYIYIWNRELRSSDIYTTAAD